MILSAYLKTVFELLSFQKRSFFKEVRGKSATIPQSERAPEHTYMIMLLFLQARVRDRSRRASRSRGYDVSDDRPKRPQSDGTFARPSGDGTRQARLNAKRPSGTSPTGVECYAFTERGLSCSSAQTMRISPTRESANTTIMMIRFMRALRASGDD